MSENQTLSEEEFLKQIFQLRAFTENTGIIHDAQVQQLKAWIMGMYGAKKYEIEIDFEKFVVNFNVYETVGRFLNSETRRSAMGKYVRFLLGDKWSVSVVKCQEKKA